MRGLARRITLVTLVTILLGVAIGGGLLYEHQQLRQRLHRQRDRAVRAVEAGRYAEARSVLRAYLRHSDRRDIQAMVSLGKALCARGTADRAQRVEAMRLFERAAALDPEDLASRRALLRLQARLGFDRALVETADQILDLTDEAATVRRVGWQRCQALMRLDRFEEAHAAAVALVRAEPTALTAHRRMLEVLARGPWPAHQPVTYAEQASQTHWSDARSAVLRACAHRLAGQPAEARAILRGVQGKPVPAAACARLLVHELEALDQFNEALTVLRRVIDTPRADETLRRMLVHRLWQRGLYEAVIGRLEGLDPSAREAPVDMLALKAMALMRTDRRAAAKPLRRALDRRSARDRAAAAWTIYIDDGFAPRADAQPIKRIRRCRRALRHDQTNAYIRFELGEALWARGERRAAVAQWRRAGEAQPAWLAPRLRLARALVALELGHQAVVAARGAQARAPSDVQARAVLALARRVNMRQGGEDSAAALLESVESIQASHPDEMRTLPLHVALLAETGQRESAAETLMAALDQPLPQDTLLRLAEVSRTALAWRVRATRSARPPTAEARRLRWRAQSSSGNAAAPSGRSVRYVSPASWMPSRRATGGWRVPVFWIAPACPGHAQRGAS